MGNKRKKSYSFCTLLSFLATTKKNSQKNLPSSSNNVRRRTSRCHQPRRCRLSRQEGFPRQEGRQEGPQEGCQEDHQEGRQEGHQEDRQEGPQEEGCQEDR